MKQSFTRVMLVCIIAATRVSADSLDAGLGVDRGSLSPEQIAARSERLEASTSFSLLRFPEALHAPARIFEPSTWRAIQAAAREYDLDPMMLAGMIFIESYGDPMAKSPTGPAGIAQLTKGSARELGLSVGRKVRIGTKSVKKTRWVGTGKNRRKVVQTVKQPVYKTVDDRYVPERAIMAMARRVSNRRSWLGGNVDFAVAEYHMGAGRMAALLSAYFGRIVRVSDVPAEMRGAVMSYPELFWTNTPYYRPAVYEALDAAQSRRLLADLLLPRAAGDAPARGVPAVPQRVRAARVHLSGSFWMECAAELAVELCQRADWRRTTGGTSARCGSPGRPGAVRAAAGYRVAVRRSCGNQPDVGRAVDDRFGAVRRASAEAPAGGSIFWISDRAHARRILRRLRGHRRRQPASETARTTAQSRCTPWDGRSTCHPPGCRNRISAISSSS